MKFILICSLLLSFPAFAENIKDPFVNIVKQSTDNSCGAAALATLINGISSDKVIQELDVISLIDDKRGEKGRGSFSLDELSYASIELGHNAEWRKVAVNDLEKIKQPVLLLIGLNSDASHYVVLKGIRNGRAFLADPIKGNIYVDYNQLVQEGVSNDSPYWYAMGIEIKSRNVAGLSSLWLSDDYNQLIATHASSAQADIYTATNISKLNQMITEISLSNSSIKSLSGDVVVRNQSTYSSLSIRYGIDSNYEVGGEVESINSNLTSYVDDQVFNDKSSESRVSAFVNRGFISSGQLDGWIVGLGINYFAKSSTMNVATTLIRYFDLKSTQVFINNQIGTDLSNQPQSTSYSNKTTLGLNIPVKQSILTMQASYDRAVSRDSESVNTISILASTSIALKKNLQMTPFVSFLNGDNRGVFLGLTFTHLGHW